MSKRGAADPARPLELQKLRNLSVKACREVVAFSDCGGVDEAAIGAPQLQTEEPKRLRMQAKPVALGCV